jgi:hypothetical protein
MKKVMGKVAKKAAPKKAAPQKVVGKAKGAPVRDIKAEYKSLMHGK